MNSDKQDKLMLYNNKIYNKYRQSNQLVESPYAQEFSAHEIKIFEIASSLVHTDDLDKVALRSNKQYQFSAKQLSEMLDTSVSTISHEIEKTAIRIMRKTIHLRRVLDNGSVEFEAINIIPYAKYENGIFTFDFNYAIIPYLLEINKNFTEYHLHYLLSMSSSYTIKLYKLLYQYKNIGFRKFMVEDLKKQFGVAGKYNIYANFKNKIIEPSILQINKLTDLKVKYNEIKLGRKISELEFVFKIKNANISLIKEPENIPDVIVYQTPDKDENLVNIINRLKVEISDSTKTMLTIFYKEKGIEYIEGSIEYAKKKSKTNFDKYLQDTLQNNWAQILIEEKKSKSVKIERQQQLQSKEKKQQEEQSMGNRQNVLDGFNKLDKSEKIKLATELAQKINIKCPDNLDKFMNNQDDYSIAYFAQKNGLVYDGNLQLELTCVFKIMQ